MSYNYDTERQKLFTEEGQRQFLQIRDNAKRLIKLSGAAMMGNIIAGASGDSWMMMACVDRLVELDEIREVPERRIPAGQHRIFALSYQELFA